MSIDPAVLRLAGRKHFFASTISSPDLPPRHRRITRRLGFQDVVDLNTADRGDGPQETTSPQ